MGGPMSVNDVSPTCAKRNSHPRRGAARNCRARRLPGLAVDRQSAGRARPPQSAKEIGWFELHFTAAAAEDPLFAGLARETVLHWHGETFDLPEGPCCWPPRNFAGTRPSASASTFRDSVSPGSDAGNDCRVVPGGRELRRRPGTRTPLDPATMRRVWRPFRSKFSEPGVRYCRRKMTPCSQACHTVKSQRLRRGTHQHGRFRGPL